ncbi:MAG TPA: rhodanese-like domain-containing protein [Ilumatobacteraceae bacterium]|nr:rhodanese-like domain-containing protein [Ilumatobacteraceae bacterium]HRB03288.1 rhodanese-like domain-containing protein [Ilumatobacteraceae bacterium]
MFFRQYYLECLSHASYLIGDTTTGRAVVVDPQRDIAEYVADAELHGLRIEKVLETHFHADFLSGHLELAERTGATIGYGHAAEGRAEFPIETYANGQVIALGEVELKILETPGHTPESISIVVHPHGSSAAPYGVLTGDTMFIGDVGRPDLLASVGVTADELARQLFHSLHEQLLTLPDDTKVYPAHGAGSACGKNLSTETVSTIGEQRRMNYALAPMSEDEFVEAVTQGQSVAPLYFSFAANRNREQRELLSDDISVPALTLSKVLAHQLDGAVVIDAREDMAFAAGHLRGSINVGLGGRFAEYAGEVMTPETPIVLVTPPGHESEARVRLARIGFDNVLGALEHPVDSFLDYPHLIEPLSRLSAAALAERIHSVADLVLVDVRNPGEVALGSIPGARHIPLPALLISLDALDPHAPTVVFCAGGYRSAIASSLLRAHGFDDVSDLVGGYTAWQTTLSGDPGLVI